VSPAYRPRKVYSRGKPKRRSGGGDFFIDRVSKEDRPGHPRTSRPGQERRRRGVGKWKMLIITRAGSGLEKSPDKYCAKSQSTYLGPYDFFTQNSGSRQEPPLTQAGRPRTRPSGVTFSQREQAGGKHFRLTGRGALPMPDGSAPSLLGMVGRAEPKQEGKTEKFVPWLTDRQTDDGRNSFLGEKSPTKKYGSAIMTSSRLH